MHYVYKITNKINGKFYIGKRKHSNPQKDPYTGSGKLIKLAIEKYGIQNFSKEILAVFEGNEEASKYEASLITENMIKSSACYNMHEGGHGGFAHINNLPASERKNILSLKLKQKQGLIDIGGTKNWTDESFKRVREQGQRNRELGLCRGHKHSEKFKKEASIRQSKRCWITNIITGESRYVFKTDPLLLNHIEGKKALKEIWVNNNTKEYLIKSEKYHEYRALGFTRGRK